jgi:GT2 family glycosyltransferase
MSARFAILILAHNKVAYTRRCLDSIPSSTAQDLQIVLVDNGSQDETPELFATFRAQYPKYQVEILTLPENRGAIVGRNLGMAQLRGEYWVFMDNDIVVRSGGWLEGLAERLQSDPRIGVVGPKLVYPQAPHAIQCAGCEVTPEGQIVFRGRGEANAAPSFNHSCDCQTLISACWMLPRQVAEEIGPLDERFSPVQFEDIDYCYRIREVGYRCVYESAVEMYHFENVTTGGTGALNYPYLTVKNGLKFKQKWKHRFSMENGPSQWSWKELPTQCIDEIPTKLPMLP